MTSIVDETFIKEVRRGLKRLDELDPDRKKFGSATHGYALRPPVPEAEIAAVEAKYGFRCPPDYRAFLLRVANGGAGPFYGLLGFGQVGAGVGAETFDTWGLKLDEPFPHTEAWDGEDLDFGQPREEDFDDDEEYEEALEDWESSEESEALDTAYHEAIGTHKGAIPICDHGCGLGDLLIVSGPEAGHVWYDGGADRSGVSPYLGAEGEPMGFADWYLGWVRGELADR